MPVHDWTRVDRSLFHSFYLGWISQLTGCLNSSVLPSAYYALCENLRDGYRPSFLVLPERDDDYDDPGHVGESRTWSASPSKTWLQAPCVSPEYAEKVISIRRCDDHHVVAAIRLSTADIKRQPHRFAAFVEWGVEVVRDDISLLIVDLFPPGPDGRRNITAALWDEFVSVDLDIPVNKPLALIAFSTGREKTAYIEPIAVADRLHDMPLFLTSELYVPVPLEATYQTAWQMFPAQLKGRLENPAP